MDGVHLIYRVSHHGNSPPDPGRLPGVDPGHPGRRADPTNQEKTIPGHPTTPQAAPRDLPGYRILPGCTPNTPGWAR